MDGTVSQEKMPLAEGHRGWHCDVNPAGWLQSPRSDPLCRKKLRLRIGTWVHLMQTRCAFQDHARLPPERGSSEGAAVTEVRRASSRAGEMGRGKSKGTWHLSSSKQEAKGRAWWPPRRLCPGLGLRSERRRQLPLGLVERALDAVEFGELGSL